MGPARFFLALSVFTSAVLYTQTAPTDLLGPPRTLEGDTDVNPSEANSPLIDDALNKRDNHEEVTADERFYRIYENGTIEFKTALSNGHIQYQRISNKVVNGQTIQVYEGYVSQRYADGRYGTTYYIADENGYRRTRVEVATVPPVLPRNGPGNQQTDIPVSIGGKSLAPEFEVSSHKPVGTFFEDLANASNLTEEDVAKRQATSELPETEENEYLGVSTEKSALPVTDEYFVKVSESTPVLPTIDENASTYIKGDGIHSETSTELPAADENVVKATDDLELAPALPSIEENTSNFGEETSTQIPALPVTDENVVKVLEASTVLPVEYDGSKSSTELPAADENVVKATDDLELSPALPSTEDVVHDEINTKLPAIPEGNDVEKATEEIEASTGLPSTEENASRSIEVDAPYSETRTEVPTTENVKATDDLELSPALPSVEENASTSIEDNAVQTETSTEVPALLEDDDVVKGSDYIEASSVLPVEASTVLPSTEENASRSIEVDAPYSETRTEVPTTENVKATDDLELSPALPSVEENASTSIEDNAVQTETSTEVPALLEDDDVVKGSDYIEASSVLPAIEENIVKISDEDDAVYSTKVPYLPVTEKAFDETSELPNAEVTKTVEEDSKENEITTNLLEVPKSEESLTKANGDLEASSVEPALPGSQNNVDNTSEDEEASRVSPTTDETLTKDVEEGISTDLPAFEENVGKSIEDDSYLIASSTDSIATIEDKDLESITEDPQQHVTTSESTELPSSDQNVNKVALDKGLEASTEVPASAKDDLIKTTLPNSEVSEDKTLEASKEIPILPTIEEHKAKSFEDNAAYPKLSTEPPALVSDVSDLPKIEEEASTELPVLPNLVDILTKKIEVSTVVPVSEELSALDVTPVYEEQNLEVSTEFPAEDILNKTAEDDVVQSESSTELPILDVTQAHEGKNLEELFSKPVEDDVFHSESITDSPALSDAEEKYLEVSTVLPLTEGNIPVYIAEPTLLISNVNATQTVIESPKDLLAVENTAGSYLQTSEDKPLEASTEVIATLSSEPNLINTFEEDLSKSESSSSALSSSGEHSEDKHVSY